MSSLLKHKNLGLAAGLLVTLGTFSQSSYALSCKQNGSIRQDIVLDKAIKDRPPIPRRAHCCGVRRPLPRLSNVRMTGTTRKGKMPTCTGILSPG